jgi:ATP-binding cassette subfamily F protein 3
MLQLQQLSLNFADKVLYDKINFTFHNDKKYALLGRNGSGKTTLFRCIMNEETNFTGKIEIPKNLSLEYLPQELSVETELTVLEFSLSAFQEILELEKKIHQLNHEVSEEKNSDVLEKKLEQLQKTTEKFEQNNGYALESEAKKILSGLGFSENEFDKKLQTFSGGWRMRAVLSKMLLKNPDFLLLDEPTNHLDIKALLWLESFLKNYEKSVIFISHDKSFINKISDRILELNPDAIDEYTGTYEDFESKKTLKLAQDEKSNFRLEKEIDRLETFINRFRYKATKAKQVQSRIKLLEKIESTRKSIRAPQKDAKFSFEVANKSAKQVFECQNIGMSYDRIIFENINKIIYRGDRIALLGENGSGKSTFLKILAKNILPTNGTVKFGEKVAVGYFAQHQTELLDTNKTVYEEILVSASEKKREKVRDILGALLFSGDDIDKKISLLSGGEKSRVVFAKLLAQDINVLLLDEPTNHLDIAAKEALQIALDEFDGTIVLISHDRSFIEGIAESIFYFKEKELTEFSGSIEEFSDEMFSSEKREKREEKQTSIDYKKSKQLRNQKRKLERDIESLEEEIETLETEKSELQKKQYEATSTNLLVELQEKISKIDEKITSSTMLWEEKTLELEAFSD